MLRRATLSYIKTSERTPIDVIDLPRLGPRCAANPSGHPTAPPPCHALCAALRVDAKARTSSVRYSGRQLILATVQRCIRAHCAKLRPTVRPNRSQPRRFGNLSHSKCASAHHLGCSVLSCVALSVLSCVVLRWSCGDLLRERLELEVRQAVLPRLAHPLFGQSKPDTNMLQHTTTRCNPS